MLLASVGQGLSRGIERSGSAQLWGRSRGLEGAHMILEPAVGVIMADV